MERRWLLCVLLGVAFGLGGCTNGPGSVAGPQEAVRCPPIQEPDGGLTAGGRLTTGTTPLPCNVEAALDSVCRNCHQARPRFGAPMALMTWEDMHQPAVSFPSQQVYQMIETRINADTEPMPPPPYELTPSDKQMLEDWIAAGAPAKDADAGACPMPDGGMPMVDPGPDTLPCNPTYEFRAHAPAPDGGLACDGFEVPTGGTGNFYECFAFKAPWKNGEQGTAWAPIIDQQAVLHHWILWETHIPQTDGSVAPCGALPASDAKFLMGWAPGGENAVMPSDVGLGLDPDSYLLLQIHYWNRTGIEGLRDRSGVAVCTGPAREKTAGVIPVGPMTLNLPAHTDNVVQPFTCPSYITSNFFGQPIQILASSPHMHNLGKSFLSQVVHDPGTPGETTETISSVDPWSFNDQTSYPHDPPITVNPGDEIKVTCTYDNTTNADVHYGEKTEDEMCFDFMLVYPFPSEKFDQLSSFVGFQVPVNCTDTFVNSLCSAIHCQ